MDIQIINELTIKFIQQDISLEELAELNAWLDLSVYNRQRFEERVKVENILLGHARWQETLEELNEFSTPNATLPPANQLLPPAKLRSLSGRRWVSGAAAAVVLGCILGGAWWVLSTKTSKLSGVVASGPAQDIPPGGNHAVLTLANGQKVLLDSAANGTVAIQGSTSISKVADGQLAYQKGSASGTIGYNVIATPRGGQYQVLLPDGSRVWLDAASSIKFPTAFTGNTREVEMTGQAYFDIRHSITMPFRVRARGQVIEDIGTKFNVNAYSDEPVVATSLEEGSVKAGGMVLANPGDQTLYDPTTDSVTLLHETDLETTLAWKDGMLEFENADLETVLRTLARWYDFDVIYETSKDTTHLFRGQLSKSVSVNVNLKILSETGYRLRVEGRKIIVLP